MGLKQHPDLVVVAALFLTLTGLSAVSMLRGGREPAGGGGGVAAPASEESGAGATLVLLRPGAADVPPGPAPSAPSATAAPPEPTGEVRILDEEEAAFLDLDRFDVILPNGLQLPRAARGLVADPPAGLCGLAVHDAGGRLYFASTSGAWSTLHVQEGSTRRTLWSAETGARHVEIAGLSGDELLLLYTDAPPFRSRRQAWDHGETFHALRISAPWSGTWRAPVSRELIAAVLDLCK